MTTDIYLPHYRLETLNRHNQEHFQYILKLYQEPEIRDRLGDITRNLVEPTMPSSHTFIPHIGNTKIGFLKVWQNPFEKNQQAELEYALEERFRNRLWGERLLIEFSDFLLKEKPVAPTYQELIVRIQKENIPSIFAAYRAGFEFHLEREYLEFHKKRK